MIYRQAGEWNNCQKVIAVLFSRLSHNEELKDQSHTHTHTPHLITRHPPLPACCRLLIPSFSQIYMVIIHALPPPPLAITFKSI